MATLRDLAAADVAEIMANGDLDIVAVFATTGGDIEVSGWFTGPTDSTVMFGQVQVEAQKPMFQAPTPLLTSVRTKNLCTIDGDTYSVERIEKTGTGVTVIHLKTSNG